MCRELTRESLIDNDEFRPDLTPRNSKQVHNCKQKIAREQKHDDIYEVNLFAEEHPGYVVDINLYPYVVVTQVHPELTKHFGSNVRAGEKVVLHYDTTWESSSPQS